MKDYIKGIEKAERRYYPAIELRAKEDRTITGYAAVFDVFSEDFGGWVEKIDKKAFDNVLDDDVVALFNHDPNYVLARNKVTLQLELDDFGLKYTFTAPNTSVANDLVENIRLGNVKSSSFAFIVGDQEWIENKDEPVVRVIKRIERLYDVSPVTYPAYPDTSVALRYLPQKKNDAQVLRTRTERLKLNILKLK